MIRSMTGYGRGEVILFDRKFIVEIKSVNHRYNEVSIKMPRILNSFEDRIKKLVSTEISRGKTDIYISYQSFSEKDIKINFNQNLADAFVSQAKLIDERYGFGEKNYFKSLLSFPDVLTVDFQSYDENILNEMWSCLEMALLDSIINISKMRKFEGENLKNDILEKVNFISEIVDSISKRSPQLNSELSDRLHKKVSEVLTDINIDESRILMEVTLLADRFCIDEELTRLSSHISQLKQILNDGGICGRKLDFLIQEMNRETNTIGSKSNDIDITKNVVELKSELEKIREQIQNIE